MENELDLYVQMVFERLEGYVYSPIKTPSSWEQRFFEYPKEEGLLKDWVTANALNPDADVYISPVLYSSPHAVKETFKTSQVVWVEFDGDRFIEFPGLPEPTAIVQTSFESHVHCYWQVDQINSTTLEDINRRLTFYLQADTSGWDCTQLLRPPNTFNRKRGRPVILASFSAGTKYDLPIFDRAPKIEGPPQVTVLQETLLPIKTVLQGKELSPLLTKQIRVESPVEPNRSSFLAKMANELAEEEFTHLEIVSCLYEIDSRIQKFTGRTDQLVRLSQLADYALARYLASEQITVYTPDQILTHTEDLQWILPGLLHTTGQMIVSSAPGVGKTQLLLQLSYSLERGKSFLGIESTESIAHSILFMSLEMDIRTLKYIFSHHQAEWKEPSQRLFVIDEQATLVKYEKLIEQIHPTVVMIDSLTELLDTDDDVSPDIKARRVMRWCRRIRRTYQCAIVLIHHNRKATEGNKKPKSLSDLAGSFQFGKDSDTVIQLWQDFKGLELSTVKTRFGPRLEFQLVRNSNLWYSKKEDVSNRPEPVQSDQKRTTGFSVNFGRHGDELHE
jgi:archaellum biogenesis ATPase FlaH